GHYTFLVKAQSPEGVWGQPVTYSFTVLPPWWRTWWMFALYAFLVIAFVVLFSRWKHRQIVYQKKILEVKVAVATKQVRDETEKVQVQKKKIEHTLNELKETQAQLIQSEKMASLGELAAGIAHEIQNPLNFVNNFSEVNKELLFEMKDEIDKGNLNEVKAIANDVIYNEEKINSHGKRADAIVKGMLQHSQTSSGIKELTNINRLADEYLRLAYHNFYAKNKDFTATIKTDYDESIGNLNIVPLDMGRAIHNLFTNAFYAVSEKQTAAKGSGHEVFNPTVTVSTKRTENGVEIKVSDNGNGIPQNITDKIFQPFFTTKPAGQGTGLGLSMSYDIITNGHGGSLKAHTTLGEGSTFIISLTVQPTKVTVENLRVDDDHE
ncbi:MAG: ATP-binding protein, partial [Bacteroidota bacterium]|nr:ATP-binding protein [Bacteroidota bacterium]